MPGKLDIDLFTLKHTDSIFEINFKYQLLKMFTAVIESLSLPFCGIVRY